MFIIISGVSGSGKNTVINALIKRNPALKKFKTCTTRSVIRPEEVLDDPYIRLTTEEFENKIATGDMFEYEVVHGNLMGTLRSTIELLKSNETNYIKDIGVEGQQSFVKRLPNEIKIVSIFLYVPKDELVERLKNRGETEIERRIGRFDYENSFINNFDYVINNKNLDETVCKIEEIIANS